MLNYAVLIPTYVSVCAIVKRKITVKGDMWQWPRRNTHQGAYLSSPIYRRSSFLMHDDPDNPRYSNTPPHLARNPRLAAKCLTLGDGRGFVRTSVTISLVGQ